MNLRPLRTPKEGGREKRGIRKGGWKEGRMREKAREGESGWGRGEEWRKKEEKVRRKRKRSELYVMSSECTGDAAHSGQAPHGTTALAMSPEDASLSSGCSKPPELSLLVTAEGVASPLWVGPSLDRSRAL